MSEDNFDWESEAQIAEESLRRNLSILGEWDAPSSGDGSRDVLRLASDWASVLVGCKLKVAELEDKEYREELEKIEAELKGAENNIPELRRRLKDAEAANERDRTIVADALHGITTAVSGYRWATEGRGPYEWNDDKYRSEFGNALDDIIKAAEPLGKVAGDRSHCPTDPEEIAKAMEG